MSRLLKRRVEGAIRRALGISQKTLWKRTTSRTGPVYCRALFDWVMIQAYPVGLPEVAEATGRPLITVKESVRRAEALASEPRFRRDVQRVAHALGVELDDVAA